MDPLTLAVGTALAGPPGGELVRVDSGAVFELLPAEDPCSIALAVDAEPRWHACSHE